MPSKFSLRLVLPALLLFYALNYMDRSALGILGEAIQADMGFSDKDMGMLHSVLLFGLLLAIIPCAALNDVFGRRKMVSLAAALWGGAMIFTGLAPGYTSLVGARLMGSANDAFTGAGAASWLSWAYPPEKRGKVLGLFHMSGPLGMACGTLLAGWLLLLTGNWRVSFFLFAVPGLLLAFIFRKLPDYEPAPFKGYFSGVPKILKTRTIVISGVATGMYGMIVFGHQAWGGPLLMRNYGLSSGQASLIFAAMLLAGAAGPFLGGMFSDFWNARSPNGRVKAAALCALAGASGKLLFYSCVGRVGLPALVVIGLFDGVLLMAATPVFFSLVQDVAEERYRGIATGLMGSISFLAGGAYGPYLMGRLSHGLGGGATGLRLAMISLTGFGIAAAVLTYLTLRRKYVQEKVA